MLDDIIKKALKSGATAADAMLIDATNLSVGCRLGKIESLERSESGDLGLRVFVGKRQAIVSATDRRPATIDALVERAVAMARAAPEDEFCGLADPAHIAKNFPSMILADDAKPTAEDLITRARAAEDAALAVKGVTNSEGASTDASSADVAVAASNGFSGRYRRTSHGISVSVLAGEGTDMVTDFDYASRVFMKDMPDAVGIGRNAGQRAVKRLNPRKMPTMQAPVVFEQRIAGSLIGEMASAISGASVARGTSFLKDKLGQQIFDGAINIFDDPFRERGLRSRPFDAEGIAPQKRKIIDNGTLTTWFLDCRSARQLKMKSTGHASRSPGGTPHPSATNLYMEAGELSPAELIKDIKNGFYVTELMGMGVNGVTGDYSLASSGFWIENGTIAFPVSEMTIASNLKDMFKNMTAANDLEFLRGVDSPTLRIEGMTIAGL